MFWCMIVFNDYVLFVVVDWNDVIVLEMMVSIWNMVDGGFKLIKML